jgi:hypothetical protein
MLATGKVYFEYTPTAIPEFWPAQREVQDERTALARRAFDKTQLPAE